MTELRKFYAYKEKIDKIVDRKILEYTNDQMTMKRIVDEITALDGMEMDMDIHAPYFFRSKYNTEISKYIQLKFHILRNVLFARKAKISDIIEAGEVVPYGNVNFIYTAKFSYMVSWRTCVMLVLENMKNRGGQSTIDMYNKFCDDPLRYCFSDEIAYSIKNNAEKYEENNLDDFLQQLKDGFKNYVNENSTRIIELADKVYNAKIQQIEIQ